MISPDRQTRWWNFVNFSQTKFSSHNFERFLRFENYDDEVARRLPPFLRYIKLFLVQSTGSQMDIIALNREALQKWYASLQNFAQLEGHACSALSYIRK